MTVSILVRLVSSAAAARHVAGEVEVVATGERKMFRDGNELMAILTAQTENQPELAFVEADSPELGAPDA